MKAASKYVLGAIAALVFLSGCKSKPSASHEAIVRDVLAGRLSPEISGRVAIPKKLSATTCDGTVYVTQDEDGTTYVFFPDWRGKGSNTIGFLYCSKIHKAAPQTFSVLVGVSNPAIPQNLQTSRVPVDIKKRVSEHWYKVGFHMD